MRLTLAGLLCGAAGCTTSGGGGGGPPGASLAPLRTEGVTAAIAGQYIVVLGSEGGVAAVAPSENSRLAAQSTAAEAVASRLGGSVTRRYRAALVGFSARLTPAALAAVRAMPGVAWVEPDQRGSIATEQFNPPIGLDRTSERLGLDQRYTHSVTGAGVHAYVLDTGIAPHADFGGRLDLTAEFTVLPPNGQDCHGHGTHVAGTIGGQTHGIAKGVTLHRVRVVDCGGFGSASDAIAGIDWVTTQRLAHNQPSVANMSLRYGLSPAMTTALTNSTNAGVTYAVAAGNDNGLDACTVSPASAPTAITTGSINPLNDQLSGFSNLGPCVDIFAPGEGIVSTWVGGGTAPSDGTSMASPHVAGVAALILEIDPTKTPAQVWDAIDFAASITGQPYNWNGIGGLAAGAAVNKLLHWGSVPSDGYMDGDPHVVTVDGVRYDFQGAGEYVYLREAGGVEVQVRHSPVATATRPTFADGHHGLATCVSVNTAVAARIGSHRVSLQPNLGGAPDPSGMQLRVDGTLKPLTAAGLVVGTALVRLAPGNGMEIRFADGSRLVALPNWWAAQNMWYMNVDIFRTTARSGLVGAIAPGSWLPALPDGTSVGAMPALAQRYAILYGKFGEAWRVTNATSLFDYAPGTTTATFTDRSWPREQGACTLPASPQPPAQPIDRDAAAALCAILEDRRLRGDCTFDVAITGERGFVEIYRRTHTFRAELNDRQQVIQPTPPKDGRD
ncbi:MAG: S8 family serine peptidase [Allosphingosinicella sp.]